MCVKINTFYSGICKSRIFFFFTPRFNNIKLNISTITKKLHVFTFAKFTTQ